MYVTVLKITTKDRSDNTVIYLTVLHCLISDTV